MSKVSQAIKEKRKENRQQHRADHYTDADHALKGKDSKERKAVREEAFNNQGNENAADFNFDQYGKGHVSGQEVRHLRKSGQSKEDIMAAAQASGGELGKRAQKRFDNWSAAKEKAEIVKENPVNPTPAPTPAPTATATPTPTAPPASNTSPSVANNSGSGPVTTTQDNDQTSNINGDNNYVNQQQDNSVRNYGGDNRIFNYQGGGNSALDTPVSNATMSGFYDYDDSPAAQAKRLDQRVTTANDYAKDNMDTDWIAQGAIHRAGQNAYINPRALDDRIQQRENASFARSQVMGANIFGDMAKFNLDWKQPDPAKPVEAPDFDKMYNTYTDF